jgi:hypothetical protein
MRLTLRSALVLAAVVLLAGATTSFAQFTAGPLVPYTVAAVSSPLARSAGITELAGDISITWATPSGGPVTVLAGGTAATAAIQFIYNSNITNTPVGASNAASAACPTGAGTLTLPASATGISVTFAGLTPSAGGTTVTCGFVISGSILSVTYTLTPTAAVNATLTFAASTLGVTIHGARVNASAITTGAITSNVIANLPFVGGGPVTIGQILTGLSSGSGVLTGSNVVVAGTTATQTGFITQPLAAVSGATVMILRANGSIGTCNLSKATGSTIYWPTSGTGSAGNFNAVIGFFVQEGFPGAFTTSAQEAAKVASVPYATTGAEANAGTRIDLILTGGVSSQMTVYAPQAVSNTSLTLALTVPSAAGSSPICSLGTTTAGQCGFQQSATTPPTITFFNTFALFASPGPSGTVTIEYEVLSNTATPLTPASAIVIPLLLYTTGTTPELVTITTAVQLGSVSTNTSPVVNTTAPILRFTAAPITGGSIKTTACTTLLLFPFVTNAAGFDTGIQISNMGLDNNKLSGSGSAQTGTCAVNFYDGSSTTYKATTIGPLAPGQGAVFLASNVAAGIGANPAYATAFCNFLLAHGFAIVVNGYGAVSPSIGSVYLALVATGSDRSGPTAPETFGN